MENQGTSPRTANVEGRLADNIVYFSRTLRKAGMRVGPAAVRDAIDAVLIAGIGSRDDFYWTLHSVLVKRREDHATFDEAFRLFWRSRELVEKMIAMFSPIAIENRERQKPKAAETRVSQALFEARQRDRMKEEPPEVEFDARLTYSGKEVLRTKDFAQMTATEMADARRAIDAMMFSFDKIETRRFRAHQRGPRIDPRATMRASLKLGGDLILPRFRARREVYPPLVVLADISGSMSQYSRVFLHFMHALMMKERRVHCFVFGTRLTNVTRQLRARDPDEAVASCTAEVMDWSGGTRIGEALRVFNRFWSRRVLSQGAVVLLITDGLERDEIDVLEHEMDRLHRSCRKLVWLNPLLRFDGFEARARGVRAMLPHVDEFRPVHNLDALGDLCAALSGRARTGHDPRRWIAHPSFQTAAAGPY